MLPPILSTLRRCLSTSRAACCPSADFGRGSLGEREDPRRSCGAAAWSISASKSPQMLAAEARSKPAYVDSPDPAFNTEDVTETRSRRTRSTLFAFPGESSIAPAEPVLNVDERLSRISDARLNHGAADHGGGGPVSLSQPAPNTHPSGTYPACFWLLLNGRLQAILLRQDRTLARSTARSTRRSSRSAIKVYRPSTTGVIRKSPPKFRGTLYPVPHFILPADALW